MHVYTSVPDCKYQDAKWIVKLPRPFTNDGK